VEAIDTSPFRSHAMQVPQRPLVQELGASIPAANAACKSLAPASATKYDEFYCCRGSIQQDLFSSLSVHHMNRATFVPGLDFVLKEFAE